MPESSEGSQESRTRAVTRFLWVEGSQIEAEKQMRAEISGTKCAVCGEEKWAYFPFCRRCSIRLQRVGLTQTLFRWRDVIKKGQVYWLKHYDIARDFLIVKPSSRTSTSGSGWDAKGSDADS